MNTACFFTNTALLSKQWTACIEVQSQVVLAKGDALQQKPQQNRAVS